MAGVYNKNTQTCTQQEVNVNEFDLNAVIDVSPNLINRGDYKERERYS